MSKKQMVSLALALFCTAIVCRAQIDSIPWNASNIAKLNKSDKAGVAAFLNKIGGSEGTPAALRADDIGEFKWMDLNGDGRCELIFAVQGIAGTLSFKDGIKDIDGDGKKEIIVDSFLDPAGIRGANPTPFWSQIYRLQDKKYVAASANYPQFYDRQVLPKLNEEIAKAERTPSLPNYSAEGAIAETGIAALEMQRDKILRVLGRDPNAGLDEARQWAKSENPMMIDNAVVVFRDIGGHEAEARAAEQARKQAFSRWLANHPNG